MNQIIQTSLVILSALIFSVPKPYVEIHGYDTPEPVEELKPINKSTHSVVSKLKPQKPPEPPRPKITGNKESWLRASGIPQSQWWAVDFIVSRESGWNPCAYYPGRSDCSANPTTACGLAQSLPCGKQSAYGHWTDPVANLKWQFDYVRSRYGGYPQAVAYWKVHHVY